MLNIERIIGLALVLAGALGIYGSIGLPLWENYTVGPGAAPLAFGAAVVICGAAVTLKPAQLNTIALAPLLERPGLDGVLLMVLMIALAISIDYLGFMSLFLFSVAGLIIIARLHPLKALLMAAVWSGFLYLVFVRLLHIPFPTGALL